MVTLIRSLVLRTLVSLTKLTAVVGLARNAGRAMPADPTPDHPRADARTSAWAGRPFEGYEGWSSAASA